MTDNSNGTNRTSQSTNNSTLLEFPGVNRNRPAWRKELSERFREIQQRRARDADETQPFPADRDETAYERPASTVGANTSESSKQLGLVPPPPGEPEMNPLVVAALRRIERARTQNPTHVRQGSGRGHAATAAARVVEEQPEQLVEQAATPVKAPATKSDDSLSVSAKHVSRRAEKSETNVKTEGTQSRTATLAVITPKLLPASIAVEETKAVAIAEASPSLASAVDVKNHVEPSPRIESRPINERQPQVIAVQSQTAVRQPRHIDGVLDEFWLERQGLDPLPKVSTPELSYDDRAPRAKRIAASIVDLIVVAFLCAPFAAAIELTISNWGDPRVYGSMAGIIVVVMFLYHTCSLALAGRTWGMKLCSLRAVDASAALAPTTWQSARRALVYIISLATLGLGILYSIFDAEGRTVHDLLSGTVVIKQ